MKTLLKSQYIYLMSKKKADALKNETIDITDEEWEELEPYDTGTVIIPEDRITPLLDRISKIEKDIKDLKGVAYDEVYIKRGVLDLSDIK